MVNYDMIAAMMAAYNSITGKEEEIKANEVNYFIDDEMLIELERETI